MSRNGKRAGSVSMVGAIAAAMVLGGLAACGQKGPLTLPAAAAPSASAPSASAPSASAAATGPAAGASR
ncbi:MAG: lipoprotein [Burkholderiales bacterium]|nr:lipoprotein [Burkholderiales bacterium]